MPAKRINNILYDIRSRFDFGKLRFVSGLFFRIFFYWPRSKNCHGIITDTAVAVLVVVGYLSFSHYRRDKGRPRMSRRVFYVFIFFFSTHDK